MLDLAYYLEHTLVFGAALRSEEGSSWMCCETQLHWRRNESKAPSIFPIASVNTVHRWSSSDIIDCAPEQPNF